MAAAHAPIAAPAQRPAAPALPPEPVAVAVPTSLVELHGKPPHGAGLIDGGAHPTSDAAFFSAARSLSDAVPSATSATQHAAAHHHHIKVQLLAHPSPAPLAEPSTTPASGQAEQRAPTDRPAESVPARPPPASDEQAAPSTSDRGGTTPAVVQALQLQQQQARRARAQAQVAALRQQQLQLAQQPRGSHSAAPCHPIHEEGPLSPGGTPAAAAVDAAAPSPSTPQPPVPAVAAPAAAGGLPAWAADLKRSDEGAEYRAWCEREAHHAQHGHHGHGGGMLRACGCVPM